MCEMFIVTLPAPAAAAAQAACLTSMRQWIEASRRGWRTPLARAVCWSYARECALAISALRRARYMPGAVREGPAHSALFEFAAGVVRGHADVVRS